MSDEALYDQLTGDPYEDLLFLESYYRDVCLKALSKLGEEDSSEPAYNRYFHVMEAVAAELALDFPSQQARDRNLQTWERFQAYVNDVEALKVRLGIRKARRSKAYTVALSSASKEKIRHHLGEIRRIVDAVENDPQKKEALFTKINALQAEVDKDRTRFDAFADLVIESAEVVDKAAGKLDNVKGLIDTIARVIWGDKKAEPKQLPSPEAPKQIEDKRKTKAIKSSEDEEIPF